MIRKLLLSLIILLWVAPSFGLEITVPNETPEYNLVAFSCDSPQPGCRWIVKGPRGDEALYLAGTGGVFTGPPGSYVVLLESPEGKTWAETKVVEGDDSPDPPRPDPPEPDPPIPGPKKVTVIYEKDSETPEQAAILSSTVLRQWMTANGHTFQPLDKDHQTADGRPSPKISELLPHVVGNLPVLFVVSKNDSLVQVAMPDSVQGVIDFVKRSGG